MPVPPTTCRDLVDLIRKSGIVPIAPDEAGLPENARAAAETLVGRGVLTRFQSQQLLAGRHKGFRLGPHVILDQLGRGGMGAVFLAEHRDLQRKVALKVLVTAKDEDQNLASERFLREARAAAALDHPNIVRLYDVGRHNNAPYLVMEYVAGETLQQILDRAGPLPADLAADAVAQAAAGLQHAHERGFVHRDIKPANLMRDRSGVVKILDMGLTRSFADPDHELTGNLGAGVVVGTADFISPEQALNAPRIDIRADIYSLGATFYALLTGHPPFEGSTAQKLVHHQLKTPPIPEEVDPKLAGVVAKMLAKRPADRYQTPAEVIAALAAWLGNNTRVLAGLSHTDLGRQTGVHASLQEIASGSSSRLFPVTPRPQSSADSSEIDPSAAVVALATHAPETGAVASAETARSPVPSKVNRLAQRTAAVPAPPVRRWKNALLLVLAGLLLLAAGTFFGALAFRG